MVGKGISSSPRIDVIPRLQTRPLDPVFIEIPTKKTKKAPILELGTKTLKRKTLKI